MILAKRIVSMDATPISRQTNNVTNRVYELGLNLQTFDRAALRLDAGTVRDLSIRYDATKPIGNWRIQNSRYPPCRAAG
jgi:cell division protein FtsI (penicillin-binding protein 3)